jgi:hypothetical protein
MMAKATLGSSASAPATKYQKLAELLRQRMRAGELRAGDRLPSFGEMRDRHQAQQATVDRAYALLEREGKIVRRARRGVFVAERAAPRHPRIGVAGLGSVLIERPLPYWLALMAGARAAAAAAEAHLELLADAPMVPAWSGLDGLLISDADAGNARARIPAGMPCVSLLVRVPGLPSVVADDQRAAGDLTRHLLYLGHRRIAYLTMLQPGQDEDANPICARRVGGYRAALSEAGIAADPRWLHAMSDQDHAEGFIGRGQRDMAAWLRTGFAESGCTALLAQNDETAAGAMAALAAAGMAVPDQVSVVGFDGTALSTLCSPRLTTAAVPLGEIGRRGMELLLAQLSGGGGEGGEIVLPATLLPRASSAPAPLPPRPRRRARA